MVAVALWATYRGIAWYIGRPEFAANRFANQFRAADWRSIFNDSLQRDGFESNLTAEQFARGMESVRLHAAVRSLEFDHLESTGRPTCFTAVFRTGAPNSPFHFRIYRGSSGWSFDPLDLLVALAKHGTEDPKVQARILGTALVDTQAERFNLATSSEFGTREDAERLASGELGLDRFWHPIPK